tara:strand:+ start:722 stop:1003 length:282 start_codon:yes stop_codon:yes gene_type:complete
MKFTKEHTATLKAAVDTVLADYPNLIAEYENGDFPRADKVKDLQTRFCFDVFYGTGLRIGDGVGTTGDIIGAYTDSHLLTALRSVCPVLTRKY